MNIDILFSHDFLKNAAFQLLSCSTVNRFIRIAKSLADATRVRYLVKNGMLSQELLCQYTETLWKQYRAKGKRDVEEIRLATILPIIAEFAIDDASRVLEFIANQETANTIWINSLAKHLYINRPMYQEYGSTTVGFATAAFITNEFSSEYESIINSVIRRSKRFNVADISKSDSEIREFVY